MGWVYLEDARKPNPPPIHSIGTVIGVTKEAVKIASTLGTKGGWLNPLTIPKGSILSWKEVKI